MLPLLFVVAGGHGAALGVLDVAYKCADYHSHAPKPASVG